MVIVSALSFLGSIELAFIAQLLVAVGLLAMGLFYPIYSVMLAFVFVHSLGMHLFMPLNDSLSMSLAEDGKVGTVMGRFKGISTLVSMLSACAVFVGFRVGFFSFEGKIILPFVIAGGASLVAGTLLLCMGKYIKKEERPVKKHRLLMRREYLPYYLLTMSYGCQKRIKIVFGPWVIIELLAMGADTLALLTIVTHFAGTAFAPVLGRLLDKHGLKPMLIVEAVYIVVSFCAMGFLSGCIVAGTFAERGVLVWAVFAVYIICMLFEQFNMVHSYLMRSIARDCTEVTESLSVGLGADHVMAVIASPVLGLIWSAWGVQYVFYVAAVSAVVQVIVAHMMGKRSAAVA